MAQSVRITTDEPTEPEAPEVEVETTPEGGVRVVPPKEGADTPTEEAADDRPEWLPEKFKSPEDMAKAYRELETRLGKGDDTEGDPPTPEEETGEDPPAEEAEETQEGLDFDALTSEFEENGELSEDTYTKLEGSGISRQVVDSYIAGQQALAAQQVSTLAAEVGGEDTLKEVLQWANANLEQAEKDAYNEAVDQGNLNAARLALRGINARFVADRGTDPNLVTGGTPKTGGVKAFASRQEMINAMKDPRYAEDPAYRRQVEARVGATDLN